MKIDREQIQMVTALVLVAAIATFILGLMDAATRGPIADAKREALTHALTQVLPEHANDPLADVMDIATGERTTRFYLSKESSQKINGIAWETVAPDGYAGSIYILIGVRPDGSVNAIRITDHRETPGLGDGIVLDDRWLASFHDKTLENARWDVKKDGGDFDQFTGATITPRAVVRAVQKGLELFKMHAEQLRSGDDESGETTDE